LSARVFETHFLVRKHTKHKGVNPSLEKNNMGIELGRILFLESFVLEHLGVRIFFNNVTKLQLIKMEIDKFWRF
jgi:hypothetical protein